MLKKILIILMILIFAVGVVSAEDASDINETLTSDDQPCNNTAEIQNLIDDANETDTINLKGTYKNENNVLMKINKSLTIDGGTDKTVIDANDKTLNIHIESGTVNLKNLKIININPRGFGPVTISNYGNLTLINCSFEHIIGESIINNNNNIEIDNCEFKDNTHEYSMISSYSEHFTMKDSRFINNTAKNILSLSEPGPEGLKVSSITDCLFTNNNITARLISYTGSTGYQYKKKSDIKYTYLNISRNVFMNVNHPPIYLNLPTVHIDYEYEPVCILTMQDNFYGFNLKDKWEFTLIPFIEYDYPTNNIDKPGWSNVYLRQHNNTTYELYYVNNENKEVKLPSATFSIKNKTSGEILASDIGIGNFTLNRNISMDNVYILTGINEIANKDPAKITYNITGNNYDNIKIGIKLENNSKPLANQKIRFDIMGLSKYDYVVHNFYWTRTGENGTAICDGSSETPGRYYLTGFLDSEYIYYNITTTFSSDEFGFTQATYSYLTIDMVPATIKAKDITSTYNSQPTLKITASSESGSENEVEVETAIYKGNKHVKSYFKVAKNGVISIKLPKVDAGTYKIKISVSSSIHKGSPKTVKWTVNKLKLTAKAPKVTNKYKKSKYFKVTVKNGKNIKIKVKIYTGKKSKTYTIKTDKNGVAKYNTKGLKVGKHKVVISSGNSNYQISAKSQITIKR